ncbi:RNA-binding protein [Nostocoides sp. F2B08]|uniref:CGNR zinc finger domain-containing protein n=1 Tax=Nostocoides sp. F2B08 TaxID=2653936 RepID=UPI001262FC8F|nr:CGNR zinc finger domain-containing protein [Tetrasphaera sp. F2B08]KAB7743511.1 RNA-binding protein [Tetrasphaera sp. F2B08]
MSFTHDTEVALQYAAALVNTRPSPSREEGLESLDDLLEQMAGWGWTGSEPSSPQDLEAVRRVRERLRDYWYSDVDEAVRITNELLRDGDARPRLVDHEPIGWHIHATDDDAPVAVRMAVDTALAMIDVIRAGELDRLKTCTAGDCDDVFVDLSRNRSRKFCDGTCGNNANVAAYRARKAAEG